MCIRDRDHPEGERSEAVEAELRKLRDDLHYVQNFPKGYKYVSIIKQEGDAEYLERKREKLRQKIKENMVADAALAEANEGGEAAAAAYADIGAAEKGGKREEKDDFFLDEDEDDADADAEEDGSDGDERDGSGSGSGSDSDSDSDSGSGGGPSPGL